MSEEANKITVNDNPAENRFEAQVGQYLAIAQYRRQGHDIIFTHTEVPEELEGQGVGGKLVRTALDTARAQNLEVVPLCPFVAGYIRRHQEYLDLVKPSYRDRVRE